MSGRVEIFIKSFIGDRKRLLVIDPAYIEFDDKDLRTAKSSRFEREDIVGIRYGVRYIRGLKFNIGRVYRIDIQHEDERVITIRMKSIYGVRKIVHEKKYVAIIHQLFENYYKDLVSHYINMFENDLPFELLGVGFRKEGLVIKPNESLIVWDDLGTRDYWSYYSLFRKSDPYYYKTFEYHVDWNTIILYTVSRHILDGKKVGKQ